MRINNEKIKMVVCYSKNYKSIYDRCFKYTFDKFLEKDFKLIPIKIEQKFRRGKNGCKKWALSTRDKIKCFYDILRNDLDSDIFVFSDCDIVFLSNIKEKLLEEFCDFDISFQMDSGNLFNTGFFICRNNEKIRKMFEYLLYNWYVNDQETMNKYFSMGNLFEIKAGELSNLFFNLWRTVFKKIHRETAKSYRKMLKDSNNFTILCNDELAYYPEFKIIMFHANYIREMSEKENVLNKIMKRFIERG